VELVRVNPDASATDWRRARINKSLVVDTDTTDEAGGVRTTMHRPGGLDLLLPTAAPTAH
jgi:hypothetical protein